MKKFLAVALLVILLLCPAGAWAGGYGRHDHHRHHDHHAEYLALGILGGVLGGIALGQAIAGSPYYPPPPPRPVYVPAPAYYGPVYLPPCRPHRPCCR